MNLYVIKLLGSYSLGVMIVRADSLKRAQSIASEYVNDLYTSVSVTQLNVDGNEDMLFDIRYAE